MLQDDFVPVAIDQWYQRRQQDSEGEFYRKVASQGPRNDFNQTTQGRYICTAGGKLLGYNNNRGTKRIGNLMKNALEELGSEKNKEAETKSSVENKNPAESLDGRPDTRFKFALAADGLTLRVHSRILDGYEPTEQWHAAFHKAVGRDNAWLQSSDIQEIVKCIENGGTLNDKIARRIARFHLEDNTRGEPSYWSDRNIKQIEIRFDTDGNIFGNVHLETDNGKRGFVAQLRGAAKSEGSRITQFDLVAKGEYWGSGKYTSFAPKGKFPLVIAFRIADGTDPSDAIAPHGTKAAGASYFE